MYDHSPYADKGLAVLSKKTSGSDFNRPGLNALRKRRGNSLTEAPSALNKHMNSGIVNPNNLT